MAFRFVGRRYQLAFATALVGLQPFQSLYAQVVVPQPSAKLYSTSIAKSTRYLKINVISQTGENGELIKDPRLALKDVLDNIMDESTKKRIRINTGYILCHNFASKTDGASGSGALYGNGNQLTTALHVIYDENGKIYEHCDFRNQEWPAQRVPLDLASDHLLPFTTNFAVHYDKDLVAIRLNAPIKGAHPFPFDPEGRSLQANDKLVAVAAHHDDQPKRLSPKEPIAVICTVRRAFAKTATAPTNVYTDCSSEHGASGGIMFRFTERAEWIMAASVVGSGDPSRDFTPYSFEGLSVSSAVGFDAEVAARLLRFQDEKSPQIEPLTPDHQTVAGPVSSASGNSERVKSSSDRH